MSSPNYELGVTFSTWTFYQLFNVLTLILTNDLTLKTTKVTGLAWKGDFGGVASLQWSHISFFGVQAEVRYSTAKIAHSMTVTVSLISPNNVQNISLFPET